MRFVSTYEAGLDDKRRVTIPADFRASLRAASAKDGSRETVDGDHLRVWQGDGRWLEASDDSFVAMIGSAAEEAAADDPEAAGDLLLDIFGASRKLSIDAAGRIVLPEAFVAGAGLTDRVTFIGVGPYFRIASPSVAEEIVAAARARSRPLKAAVMAAARLKSREPGR